MPDPATEIAERRGRRSKEPLSVVVFTSRPAVRALFSEIGRDRQHAVTTHDASLEAAAVEGAADAVTSAGVAVVDPCADHAEAIAVCEEIRAIRPRLPISSVICCAHAATASADLRELIAAGVQGIVDLQLSPADTVRLLRGVARGQGALHVQLPAGPSSSLAELLTSHDEMQEFSDPDLDLLRLVAGGLTDHEISAQLYLSRHTVKHRIERLRRRVAARNRIQLAAWAASRVTLRATGE